MSIRCPSATRGNIVLKASRKTIGRGKFSVRAGKAKKVKVKLSRKGRQAVRRHKRLHAKAIVRTRGVSAFSRKPKAKTITIRAARGHR